MIHPATALIEPRAPGRGERDVQFDEDACLARTALHPRQGTETSLNFVVNRSQAFNSAQVRQALTAPAPASANDLASVGVDGDLHDRGLIVVIGGKGHAALFSPGARAAGTAVATYTALVAQIFPGSLLLLLFTSGVK